MRYLIILFLVFSTFSFSQKNDKYITALLNDTVFLTKLRYIDCDTIIIIDKTKSLMIKSVQNYNNQIFELKNDFSEDDSDPFKYNKREYYKISNDQRTKLINCSTLFILNIVKKGKMTTVEYFCPQKDLLGKIKFKCKRNNVIIIDRQMGYL
ncbi:MAG: hypothetical protein R2805_10810 [Flavobacterium sp.]|uniref:hypothetical protein n=1 Tax=Flavobacterium sp. TaxID=239 RepID=UPI0035271CAA